jgi:ParB family transcriptional regulator, chromosome partitioning protein
MDGTRTIVIPVDHLDVSKPADFDKGKVEQMAASIKADGMIHRPVARPTKDKEGWYDVIVGRKRVYAAAKILGWTEIECDVIELDDRAAESVEIAENVFRTALSDDAQMKALIKWNAIYVERYPDADGRGGYRQRAEAAQADC